MPPRYLIFSIRDPVWTERAASYAERKYRLRRIRFSERAIVLVAPEAERLVVEPSMGVVIGPLFSAGGSPRPIRQLSENMSREFSASAAFNLLSVAWGAYVAVAIEATGGTVSVLRDPSAAMPCYVADLPQAAIFGSDVRSIFDVSGRRPEIDWNELAGILNTPYLTTHRTALRGVWECCPAIKRATGGKG